MIIKQGHTSASHQVLQGEAGSLRQVKLSTLGAHNLTESPTCISNSGLSTTIKQVGSIQLGNL